MILKTSIILLAGVTAAPAYSRFHEEDARLIDQEERANTETWNDKNSYRYPKRWDDLWQRTEIGYRVSAGSLNASRFNFDDDLRVAPKPLDEFTASFTQSGRGDLVEQKEEREIRVGWAFASGSRISLLGDAGTFKEYGDMGAALSILEAEGEHTEFYYWSVDNYYGTKKSDETAYRSRETKTVGLYSVRIPEKGRVGWTARYELDSPLDWTHPDAGYHYQYVRRYGNARVDIPVEDKVSVFFSGLYESKIEKKDYLLAEVSQSVFKSMHRVTNVAELGIELEHGDGNTYIASMQDVRRDVDYKNGQKIDLSPSWQESYAPAKVRRDETALLMTAYKPLTSKIALQHGLFINSVRVSEDHKRWDTTEVKYQLFFDFLLNNNTMFGLNTTWDLDQIIRDYPYPKKTPFRPWGGGDLQFLMRI